MFRAVVLTMGSGCHHHLAGPVTDILTTAPLLMLGRVKVSGKVSFTFARLPVPASP